MALRFLTVERLGPKQSLTPEGFLLCEEVPIARTGTMIYGPNEVPIAPNKDGVVKVHREEDEVFRPEFIASFVGKPITIEHPENDVNPSNWQKLTVGVVLNPRRGQGIMDDLLLADFLITVEAGIKEIRGGTREVSCGYEADYEEIDDGEGKQTNMIGNHVALVEAGRCGPRCSIGDSSKTLTGDLPMKTRDSKKSNSWMDRIRDAFKSGDSKEMEEAMKDAESETGGAVGSEEHTHVHVHTEGATDDEEGPDLAEHIKQNAKEHKQMMDRISALEESMKGRTTDDDDDDDDDKKSKDGKRGKDAEAEKEIEGNLEEEAPEGTGDKARKARDSIYLDDSFQSTVAGAEILAPGIRIPTFDHKSDPKKTLDTICKLRRNALDLAYNTAEGRGMIEDLNGGALNMSGMKCNQVRTLFRASVAMKKKANNSTTNDQRRTVGGVEVRGTVQSLADINRLNAERYSGKH